MPSILDDLFDAPIEPNETQAQPEQKQAPLTEDAPTAIQDRIGKALLSPEDRAARPPSPIGLPPIVASPAGIDLCGYQWDAVQQMVAQGSTLMADEQGLGKTRQAIAALALADAFPAIVYAPPAIAWVWEEELEALLPGVKTHIVEGVRQQHDRREHGEDVTIVPYTAQPPVIRPGEYRAFVADESHYLKNGEAQRTQKILGMVDALGDTMKLLLSGTPVFSEPQDLVAQLRILGRLWCFGSSQNFERTFLWPQSKYVQKRGARNTGLLNEGLRRCAGLIRRRKRDVLPNLPEKNREIVETPLRPDVAEILTNASADLMKKRVKLPKNQYFALLSRLRATISAAKQDGVAEWIRLFKEVNSQDQLIVMGWYADPLKKLAAEFQDECVLVNGATTAKKKKQAVKDFQAGNARIFFGNITSAGVGLTLHRAHHVKVYDLPWTATELMQAEDRAHRIGQTKEVTSWLGVAAGTIDINVLRTLQRRIREQEKIIDGEPE